MAAREEVSDTPLVPSLHDREAEAGLTTKERILQSPYRGARPPTPWYRTKKWVITLLILGVVIVAAVVGGAVGGTVGHHKNNNNSSNSTSPTNSTSSGIPSSAPLTVAGTDGGVGGVNVRVNLGFFLSGWYGIGEEDVGNRSVRDEEYA